MTKVTSVTPTMRPPLLLLLLLGIVLVVVVLPIRGSVHNIDSKTIDRIKFMERIHALANQMDDERAQMERDQKEPELDQLPSDIYGAQLHVALTLPKEDDQLHGEDSDDDLTSDIDEDWDIDYYDDEDDVVDGDVEEWYSDDEEIYHQPQQKRVKQDDNQQPKNDYDWNDDGKEFELRKIDDDQILYQISDSDYELGEIGSAVYDENNEVFNYQSWLEKLLASQKKIDMEQQKLKDLQVQQEKLQSNKKIMDESSNDKNTENPTQSPKEGPPTIAPTQLPTEKPTQPPTEASTQSPTVAPTQTPTVAPTQPPTVVSTPPPTIALTQPPTVAPTEKPIVTPTEKPTVTSTENPTQAPTQSPTVASTQAPTEKPIVTPTEKPTVLPTEKPTQPPTVSTQPPTVSTQPPTDAPTQPPTQPPTDAPTQPPIEKPTVAPTEKPTVPPTEKPTVASTEKPTPAPTQSPTETTQPPTIVSTQPPTESPIEPKEETCGLELKQTIVKNLTYPAVLKSLEVINHEPFAHHLIIIMRKIVTGSVFNSNVKVESVWTSITPQPEGLIYHLYFIGNYDDDDQFYVLCDNGTTIPSTPTPAPIQTPTPSPSKNPAPIPPKSARCTLRVQQKKIGYVRVGYLVKYIFWAEIENVDREHSVGKVTLQFGGPVTNINGLVALKGNSTKDIKYTIPSISLPIKPSSFYTFTYFSPEQVEISFIEPESCSKLPPRVAAGGALDSEDETGGQNCKVTVQQHLVDRKQGIRGQTISTFEVEMVNSSPKSKLFDVVMRPVGDSLGEASGVEFWKKPSLFNSEPSNNAIHWPSQVRSIGIDPGQTYIWYYNQVNNYVPATIQIIQTICIPEYNNISPQDKRKQGKEHADQDEENEEPVEKIVKRRKKRTTRLLKDLETLKLIEKKLENYINNNKDK